MAKSKLFVKVLLIPCTIKNVTLLCRNTGLFYLKVCHSSASVAHKPKLKIIPMLDQESILNTVCDFLKKTGIFVINKLSQI